MHDLYISDEEFKTPSEQSNDLATARDNEVTDDDANISGSYIIVWN